MGKLLIFTQKIDSRDPILGFFCGWVEALAGHFESIQVICLEKGKYNLPENVKIFSLGKELGKNKFQYVLKFFHLSFFSSLNYDSVFVHMNQEYVLLGGLCWRLKGVPVYMWRNHSSGNFVTRIAIALCTKVFCTSKQSFTARFRKTIIMPAGVDIERFKEEKIERLENRKNKILFLGRISPIKRPDLLIDALNILHKKGTDFVCDIYGDALPKDRIYYDSLRNKVKRLNLENKIKFHKAVPNYETPKIYNEHEIFVNLTAEGSFDKTIVESVSCGMVPIVLNKSLEDMLPRICVTGDDPMGISRSIQNILNTPVSPEIREKLEEFSKSQSLSELTRKLVKEI